MKLIHDTETGTIAAVGAGRYFPFGAATGSDLNSANAVKKVWGGWTDVSHAEFQENVRATGADMTRLSSPFPYAEVEAAINFAPVLDAIHALPTEHPTVDLSPVLNAIASIPAGSADLSPVVAAVQALEARLAGLTLKAA
jgi:hypothetical protein